ncbi:NAD-dependent epimerase/dehydratase [Rhodopseudomonas palustris HaA2]|uniref:NAD-dependent epimerase/dehydratase n=1 Tax=Rhodopseudomonas palustris (strain HaA2) TaxID=316058 RepID=Q2IZU9_RHOP2|nr:NAD-dependent epimerase/dehydratase [Rhodopseudomonas palustris HaA2]
MRQGVSFRAAVHRNEQGLPPGIDLVRGTRLDRDFDWGPALQGCDAVVHLGARVHVMNDGSADPLAEYRLTNVEGTMNLGRHAAAHVRRFVFVSSVKVNGEETAPGRSISETDGPAPVDPYGISKLEAEIGLRTLAWREPGLVILRPPLVYGPGVRANFRTMMRWLHRGVPLPLGSIENRRSLIGVDNLVDVIMTSLVHPAAANQTFLVSDGEDLSTPALLTRLAAALEVRARLLPFPPVLLERLARLAGQGAAISRLQNSLSLEIGKARQLLEWTPPVSVDEGLRRTAAAFLSERSGGSVVP